MKKMWDQFTDKFGRTLLHPQYFLKKYEHRAVEEVLKNAKGILVDIGCGRQPYKKLILPHVKKYIGVDHPEVSKKYKAHEKPNILADASNIPLPNSSSDIILMISVLEHLDDPGKALKEANRITKKGGKIILITTQNYPVHDPPHDYFRFTKFGLKHLLENAGYKKVRQKNLGNFCVQFGQYFNVFLLNKLKLIHNKYSPFSFSLFPFVLLITLLSNFLVSLLSPLFKDSNNGEFAIYHLLVGTK